MNRGWMLVAMVGASTMLIKAAGPVLFGGRAMGPRLGSVLALLAPAVFGALVAVNTLARGQRLVVDARIAGLLAAGIGAHVRIPAPIVLVGAAAVTALVRLVLPGEQ